jgi:hypothetical protein
MHFKVSNASSILNYTQCVLNTASWEEGRFLARQYARTPQVVRLLIVRYSIYNGKVEQYVSSGSSLFQVVAQVNPTAQNTFLLLISLCSFLASGFIRFSSPLLQSACRLL